MPWFMVDDQLAMNKKVAAAGNAAMGLWVRAGSWSQKELTGGFIPTNIARTLGTSAQAKSLVTVGLWVKVEGGYLFHDWDKHQMSVEEIRERRRKRAEAGRLGGQASGESRRSARAEANASQKVDQVPKQKRTPGPGPGLSLVTKGGELTSVGDDPEPPRYCDDHPNDTGGYCAACIPRRTAHDAWKKRQEAQERERRERQKWLQKNCSRCQGTNTYEDDRGRVHPCRPHQPPHQEVVNE